MNVGHRFVMVAGRSLLGSLRAVGRFLRRILIGGNPPTLKTMLYRVILLAVFVPMFVTGQLNACQQAQEMRATNQDLISLEMSRASGALIMPGSDYREIRKIYVGSNSNMAGTWALSWPLDSRELVDLGLSSEARGELETRGYSYGSTMFEGQEVRYAVWVNQPRVPALSDGTIDPNDPNQQPSVTYAFSAPPSWTRPLFNWSFSLVMSVLVLSIVAWPAAAFLDRRIARPVKRVAEAATRLADSGSTIRLPTDGPEELASLSDSFNRMAVKLENAERAEKDFLLSVSHELKTPLTAIDGYAELLADGVVTGRDAAPVLLSETRRLERLVSDLLDLARMNQEGFSVRRESVDLADVIHQISQRHVVQARDLGVQLVTHSQPGQTVLADEDRLVQAVSNLVENALRCTPPERSVLVEALGTTITVRDQGPGLSAEDLLHAFERFYLHERFRGRNSVGTGLGLAIVKELTEKMGGTVTVESERGEGSTFVIDLTPAPPFAQTEN